MSETKKKLVTITPAKPVVIKGVVCRRIARPMFLETSEIHSALMQHAYVDEHILNESGELVKLVRLDLTNYEADNSAGTKAKQPEAAPTPAAPAAPKEPPAPTATEETEKVVSEEESEEEHTEEVASAPKSRRR